MRFETARPHYLAEHEQAAAGLRIRQLLTIALNLPEPASHMCEVPQALDKPHQKAPLPPRRGFRFAGGHMPESGWQRRFEDPIPLPDRGALHTLRDAADYITGLPKSTRI